MSAPTVTLYSDRLGGLPGVEAAVRESRHDYVEIEIRTTRRASYVIPLQYLSARSSSPSPPGGVRHWSEYRDEQIGDRGRELDAIAYLQAASGTVGEVTE